MNLDEVLDWIGKAWQWVDTNADGLVALLTLLAVVVAVRTLNSSKADSEERSRPVVTGELRPIGHVHGAVALVVANRGSTPAHDVAVTFDPPIPYIPEEKRFSSSMWYLTKRYAKPIPSLAPRQEFSNIYRTIGGDDDNGPDRTTMTVEYRGRGKKRYRDRYVLDLEPLMSETVIGNSRSMEAQTVEGVKQLKTIAQTLQVFSTVGVRLREPQTAEDRKRIQERNDSVRRTLAARGHGDEVPDTEQPSSQ